jgi:transposase InsO family protein
MPANGPPGSGSPFACAPPEGDPWPFSLQQAAPRPAPLLAGSVGDSFGNAPAETINGLFKAKVIWRQRSWPSVSAVEMATLRWVDWFNNHRLFGPIGHIPPAEAEASYYAARDNLDMIA